MIYFDDEMKVGMMHDHINSYTVKFWHTNEEGYFTKSSLTMFIEDGEENGPEHLFDKIAKRLKKRYKDVQVVAVRYQ